LSFLSFFLPLLSFSWWLGWVPSATECNGAQRSATECNGVTRDASE
jgi:hypothetical protein